jgi:Kef-type K+ transport system membrane component KefB
MESIAESLKEPVVSFALLLAVILLVPLIFERLRVPGLVGLLAAGFLLGSNGLDILDKKSETMMLLSDIGKIYLMFVSGQPSSFADIVGDLFCCYPLWF